jgi:hypothetical protein
MPWDEADEGFSPDHGFAASSAETVVCPSLENPVKHLIHQTYCARMRML